MQKYAVVLACLSSLALAPGCTSRQPDTTDAFVPPIDAFVPSDTGALTDTNVRPDTATDADVSCGTTDLHSDVGDAVTMGTTVGGTDRDMSSCQTLSSPDVWFTWTAPAAGAYAFDTIGSDFDTALDILPSCSGTSLGCDDDGGTGVTSRMQLMLAAHQTVIVIVDGHSDDSGNYVLNIHSVVPEACHDSIDNDMDGATDCADSDCNVDPLCTETGAECTDTLDNDMDGDIDCADFDCSSEPACNETGTECSDGIDNDTDGDIDCADFDCWGEPACIESNCTDSVDNDMDGATDCADSDCSAETQCDESMHCDDTVDNDADGLVDCADIDCSSFVSCDEAMHCDDGLDNDGDFDVDCADFDCAAFPACTEVGHCADFIDNDADDNTDCADTECAADPHCTTHETNCNDGVDNDFDDTIDCADTDCAAHCGEMTVAMCMNATDDDADTFIDCADRQCSCSTACPPAMPPSATCPDSDIGSALGNGVFHGTLAPYSCGLRSDSLCGTGGLGGEIELAWKAPANGYYVFDTNDTGHAGGVYDTLISVRDGCDAASSEIDCGNNLGTGHLSEVGVDLLQDQMIIIVIDANNVWDGGNVTLNIHRH